MKSLLFIILITFIFPDQIQVLGRDKDPKLASDISSFSLLKRKLSWQLLTSPGMRFLTKLIYPKSTISHFDVDGMVAFTIDDGFCGVDNLEGCMIDEVRLLFKSYNAKATFFTTGSHCNDQFKSQIELLLADGHEIANHSMMDWSYASYNEDEFLSDFNQTNSILTQYTDMIPPWYRAPFGRLSKTMQKVLDDKGITHIVCDSFANDTAIPDSEWISTFILNRVKPGSVILIHMPEKGVREWNIEAMRLTLEGLKDKGLEVVTVSDIYEQSQLMD